MGIDSEIYTNASMKMSKQILSNAQAFTTLGVAVKDTATGAYRPITEVMAEVNEKLGAIKNPIEQNIAGMQVYGEGWREVRSLVKLTSDEMARAEGRARDLGLIVGPEGAKAAKQYKEQMRDLALVGKSLEVQFGNALLPIFVRTGSFMSEEGPAAAKVFGNVLNGVAFAASSVWLALKDMGDGLGAVFAQAGALLNGDIAGFRAIGAARDAESAKNEAAYERLKKRFSEGMPAPSFTPPRRPGQTEAEERYNFKPEKETGGKADPSRMGDWEAALSEKRAALARQSMEEGQLRELSKAEELKYWQALKGMVGLNATERIQLSKKVAEVETTMVKEGFEQKVRVLESDAALYRNNTDKRMALELQIQAMYAKGTKGYEDAQKRINEITRQSLEQDKQVATIRAQASRDAALAELEGRQQIMQLDADMGLITQRQVLEQQRGFEVEKNAIALQGLQERLIIAQVDPDRNIVEIARIHQEIEQAEQQHQLRLNEIRRQLTLEQTSNSRQIWNTITGDTQAGLAKLIQLQSTFSGFMKSIWQSIAGAISKAMSQIVMKFILDTKVMAAVKKAFAIFDIGANAAQAGAGAAASAAETPGIGWLIAAGAAAAAFAMASNFSGKMPTFSAAQGFDIPRGMNPVTQLHETEMVLPGKYADVIRSLASNTPGEGVAGASASPIHIHGSPNDSIQLKDLGKVLKKMHRDFEFVG